MKLPKGPVGFLIQQLIQLGNTSKDLFLILSGNKPIQQLPTRNVFDEYRDSILTTISIDEYMQFVHELYNLINLYPKISDCYHKTTTDIDHSKFIKVRSDFCYSFNNINNKYFQVCNILYWTYIKHTGQTTNKSIKYYSEYCNNIHISQMYDFNEQEQYHELEQFFNRCDNNVRQIQGKSMEQEKTPNHTTKKSIT